MKKAFLLILGLVLAPILAQNQTIDSTTTQEVKLKEVVVSATRANDKIPVTYSKIEKKELAKVNLGQDIPILLNYMPNIVSTTFDGTGIGYTDYRIRGADNSRINVTINGIPYNDADSQTTFFVNLQDFASSVENIQIQRGVGTSTNGAGAFGASVNILTDTPSEQGYAQISSSFGSFGARKNTVRVGSGLLNNHWTLEGRLSKITSDGFVDRAFSDLSSYYLSGNYEDDNTNIKALVFGGEERTGLSFFGLNAARIDTDRTANDDGAYLDANGNLQFYEDQTDNYRQNHFQLHLSQKLSATWSGNISFHYTDSDGFFEQYIEGDPSFFNGDLNFYRLSSFEANGETIDRSDLVTRRHLNSDFYGTVFSLLHQKEGLNLTLGGAYNYYDGAQYGEIISVEFAQLPDIPFRFYENNTDKHDFNGYAKAVFDVNDKLSLFGDAQVRRVSYNAFGDLFNLGSLIAVDQDFTFFNPKAGLTYRPNHQNSIYLSYARANREPSRVDFETGTPEPESLNDWELGWRYVSTNFQLNTNFYFLDFKNQLVLTGGLDEVGFPIRTNSGESYRLGLEVDANLTLNRWTIKPNFSLSTNKNQDFLVEDGNGSFINLGDTHISFSPEVIFGNVLMYQFSDTFNASLFSKYVGEQFMTNDNTNLLEAYFINDLNLQYQLKTLPFMKSARLNLQINNLFDVQYENNGYVFFGESFFFPQAGINFLTGITLDF